MSEFLSVARISLYCFLHMVLRHGIDGTRSENRLVVLGEKNQVVAWATKKGSIRRTSNRKDKWYCRIAFVLPFGVIRGSLSSSYLHYRFPIRHWSSPDRWKEWRLGTPFISFWNSPRTFLWLLQPWKPLCSSWVTECTQSLVQAAYVFGYGDLSSKYSVSIRRPWSAQDVKFCLYQVSWNWEPVELEDLQWILWLSNIWIEYWRVIGQQLKKWTKKRCHWLLYSFPYSIVGYGRNPYFPSREKRTNSEEDYQPSGTICLVQTL
jgi:hypothetical protein